MKNTLITLLFASVLSLSACDEYSSEAYQPYYVVESYQAAKESLAPVRLSTTSNIDQPYKFSDQAVRNAQVTITLIAENTTDTPEQVFAFVEDSAGVYVPAASVTHRVIPRRTYRLDISGLNSPGITATTIRGYTNVPDSVHIERLGLESQTTRPAYTPGTYRDVFYQQQDQLVVDVTVGELTSDRNQNFFVFSIIAEDTARTNLTPFYAAVIDDDEIEQVYVNSSGIVNQKNYALNPDNTVSIKFPWIAIAFYGRNTIIINSIDRNMYDFSRSQQVQLGGGTISPGEIHNPIYHLDGALGVFGSLSRVEYGLNVQRLPIFAKKN